MSDVNTRFIKRGDIFYIDIPKDPSKPHKQTGERPCIVVSNDMNNKHNSVINYVPLTSRDKKYIPTHVEMTSTICLERESIALCECIDSIDKMFIKDKIGRVSYEDMMKIDRGLDIQVNPERENKVRFIINNPQKYACV